jgi:cytochrome c-type biogenesis protein CcmH
VTQCLPPRLPLCAELNRMMTKASLSAPRLLTTAGRILLALGVTALFFTAPANAQSTARAKALGEKMMCVCGCNQILTACNHVGCQYSHKMLQELDQLVARNDSDDLILQAFVQEYGPTVLAEPPTKGFNWAAWIVPIVVPIVALFLVWQVVRRWRTRAQLAPASGPDISPELLARAQHEADDDADG